MSAICARHNVGLTRLYYRVLDDHDVPRRRPVGPTEISARRRGAIAAAFHAGDTLHAVADRFGESPSTVSSIGRRDHQPRGHVRSRDKLGELIVTWFTGGTLTGSSVKRSPGSGSAPGAAASPL